MQTVEEELKVTTERVLELEKALEAALDFICWRWCEDGEHIKICEHYSKLLGI